MRSARFCLIFTNAFGPVHRAFVSKQKPLPVRSNIYSSNSKRVGQHWERILAYFDRRLIFENGKVVPSPEAGQQVRGLESALSKKNWIFG